VLMGKGFPIGARNLKGTIVIYTNISGVLLTGSCTRSTLETIYSRPYTYVRLSIIRQIDCNYL